jgi:hypothetical protein
LLPFCRPSTLQSPTADDAAVGAQDAVVPDDWVASSSLRPPVVETA